MADNGVHPVEEDPAAAFLAQQESEIAVIENDDEGFGVLEDTEQPPQDLAQPTTVEYGESVIRSSLFVY